jgi:D-lactate dehydrogenase
VPWTAREDAAAVYFPACVNRIFGNPRSAPQRPSLPEALVTVSARAGRPLWIPPDVAGRCCATPWASKGFEDGHAEMARATAAAVLEWTEQGRLPLLVDASSCTLGLLAEVPERLAEEQREAYSKVRILDSISWVRHELLGALSVHERLSTIAVHPPCAAAHLGLSGELAEIAGALAERVLAPLGPSCCGTAGDRGLLHPELPAAAARSDRAERGAEHADAHVCANRTCEIGLTTATGAEHGSFVLLLEELTRPGAARAQ